MGNEGVNKLASVLQNRMHCMNEKPQVLDFGQIQGDMSLLTNQFPKPIPQGDYMVCRQLTLGSKSSPIDSEPMTQESGNFDGKHDPIHASEGKHQHILLVPEKMRSIKPGDRVLVAWVGDDACVIDIILPGTAV